MTSEGDKTMVASWTPENTDVDTTTFASDSTTGKAISNLFDAASDPEVAYLSRSDWTGTFPKHYGESSGEINTWGNEINCKDSDGNNASCTWKKTASTKLIKHLEGNDSGTTVDKDSIMDTPTFGKKNGLKVSDMRGLAYDDRNGTRSLTSSPRTITTSSSTSPATAWTTSNPWTSRSKPMLIRPPVGCTEAPARPSQAS